MNLKRICDKHEMNYRTVQTRLRRGWTLEKALNTPIQKHRTMNNILARKENLFDLLVDKSNTI
jgi:hypothetical protein